jgi:hypothetical protein
LGVGGNSGKGKGGRRGKKKDKNRKGKWVKGLNEREGMREEVREGDAWKREG